ncbi:MAG: hypothetical protein RL375_1488 [Pseudomonadota bacterium]|jgi:hypothetical protein
MSRSNRQGLIVAAALSLGALFAPAAHAEGWQFLPLLSDASFKFEPTLALTVNRLAPDQGDSATAYGLDLNFNCALLQSPDKRIRTHLNMSGTDEGGVKTTAFELSPRYTMPVGMPGLSLGVGPSLAVFKVEAAGTSSNLTGVGLAGGINYRAGAFYVGADVRMHSTSAKNGVDLDPVTWGLKAGFNF